MVGVVAAAWALLRSPLLAVDDIRVTGSEHVARDAAMQASGIAPGTAMMDVSPSRAEKRLEALPWIASATVKREWPNRVEMRLVDRDPVAQVAVGDSFALVDDTGLVLQTGGARVGELPVLVGRPAGEAGSRVKDAGPLLQTAVAVPPSRRGDVVDIGFDADGSIALSWRDGGVVTLGRAEAIEAKFSSLETMIDHLGGLAEGCTLDVSVPTAPTLTPEYGCA